MYLLEMCIVDENNFEVRKFPTGLFIKLMLFMRKHCRQPETSVWTEIENSHIRKNLVTINSTCRIFNWSC